jgi:membrane protein
MWSVLKSAFDSWLAHKSPRLGAALAYYSVFSLGPLLLIVVSVAGLFFGGASVRDALTSQFQSLLGTAGSQAVEAMLRGADTPTSGILSGAVGIVLLLVAALGVVVQLKDALNTIWEVEQPKTGGIVSYLRTYLVSFAGILALGFLLAVSLVISTALAALSGWMGAGESIFWTAVNFVASSLVLTALFAALFRWFPDAEVTWRCALIGGLVTALLFSAGKFVIGWYIGTQGLESTYGAAASVVVLLVWIYYSSQIVLFGAEITRVLEVQSTGQAPHKALEGPGIGERSSAPN